MLRIPFTLSSLGYVRDKQDPMLVVSKDGHPFYPVRLHDDKIYSDGECIRLIAEAAFSQGQAHQAQVTAQATRPAGK